MATVGDIVEVVDKIKEENRKLKGLDFTREQCELISKLGDIVFEHIGLRDVRSPFALTIQVNAEAESVLHTLRGFLI